MVSLSTARALWADATRMTDEVLAVYLAAAESAVYAYAPADLFVGSEALTLATVMQARNIFNAGKVSANGDVDGSGFGITMMPLDWQIKQLLRPQRAIGSIA